MERPNRRSVVPDTICSLAHLSNRIGISQIPSNLRVECVQSGECDCMIAILDYLFEDIVLFTETLVVELNITYPDLDTPQCS